MASTVEYGQTRRASRFVVPRAIHRTPLLVFHWNGFWWCALGTVLGTVLEIVPGVVWTGTLFWEVKFSFCFRIIDSNRRYSCSILLFLVFVCWGFSQIIAKVCLLLLTDAVSFILSGGYDDIEWAWILRRWPFRSSNWKVRCCFSICMFVTSVTIFGRRFSSRWGAFRDHLGGGGSRAFRG